MDVPKRSVLFVCVANAFRSQMAEAITRRMGDGCWEVWSAGTHPMGSLPKRVIDAMREQGYDLSEQYSKGLDQVPQRTWDYVIGVGCEPAVAEVLPAKHHLYWDLPDPALLGDNQVVAMRDHLTQLVETFIRKEQ